MCRSEPFLDTDSFWNSTTPRLSKCFQETVINIIPTGILLLVVILYYSKKKKNIQGRLSKLSKFRAAACFLVIIGHLVWFINSLLEIQHDHLLFFDDSLPFSLLFNSIKMILYISLMSMIYPGNIKKINGILWIAPIFEFIYLAIRTYHLYLDSDSSSFGRDLTVSYFQLASCVLLFLSLSFDESNVEPCNKSGLISRDESTFCGNLFTAWFIRLLNYGRKKALEWDDLPSLPEKLRSSKLAPIFHQEYTRKRNQTSDRSTNPIKSERILVKLYWKDSVLFLVLSLTDAIVGCSLPILIKYFLRYINLGPDEPQWHGYLIGFAMTLGAILTPFLRYHYGDLLFQLRTKVHISLSTAIYGKMIGLKRISRPSFTDGKILNLMAVDTESIATMIQFTGNLFGRLLIGILSLFLLYSTVGIASLIGLFVWIVLIVPTFKAARYIKQMLIKKIPISDKRIKLINEILNGIKSVKMYAWEECFLQEVFRLRDQEMVFVQKFDLVLSCNIAAAGIGPVACALAIVIYQWIWDPSSFSAESVFIMLPLVNMMRDCFNILPYAYQQIWTARISIARINSFLNLKESVEYVVKKTEMTSLAMSGGQFSWSKTDQDSMSSSNEATIVEREMVEITKNFSLRGVDFETSKGQFVCIIGPVGSGKTSLLNALLGEMVKIQGEVVIPANMKIALVPQESWIQNMTLRENILFGRECDESWYRQVLTACELWPDIAILPHGDQSEIGENGINLSGGQKQRVNLARAVYQNADIYILDDCLSAVDAHVSRRLYEQVFSSQTGLLKSKTRIMTTHRLDFLSEVDKIIVLEDGSIKWTGKFDQLLQSDSIGPKILESISSVMNCSTGESIKKQGSTSNETKKSDLTGEEKIKEGSLSKEMLLTFWRKSPTHWMVIMIASIVGTVAASVYSRIVLMNWTEKSNTNQHNGSTYFSLYVGSSIGLGILFLFMNIASGLVYTKFAAELYNDAQKAVFHSPLRFFDTTPIGRILNRFAQDTNSLDFQARTTFKVLFWSISNLLPVLIGSTIQAPSISFMMLGILIYLVFLWKFMMPGYRQLKKLHSVSQSPIYSHFRETLSGSTCIRAFQADDRFSLDFFKKLDISENCSYLVNLMTAWRGSALSLVTSVLYVFLTFHGVSNRGKESTGGIGLLFSYFIGLNESLSYFALAVSDLEIAHVAADRLHEFSLLPAEGDRHGRPKDLPIDWPASGEITFQNYSAKYSKTLSPVLRDVAFSINKREKIGIVGRTGAGKSSLTLALYRLIERLQGSITIDGADISNIGLFHLRSALSIIPQDPVIFSGTLRFNLDPFKKHSDAEIWRCLELTQLRPYIEKFGQGLEYTLEEGGKNLSTGQKQLMCLARSILKKSKIIVLDEATSSIDMETDSLIQETLKTEFTESTMLIVAHRLNTIINCDRIMVFEQGKLVEFDSPENLLANKTSRFSDLAREAKISYN